MVRVKRKNSGDAMLASWACVVGRMAAWLGSWLKWMALCGGVVFWSKITIAKEKRLSEDHSPYKSHIFPLYNRIGPTTHELTEISHLGTFMM